MANTTGKKFGGREKGTQNKTSKEIREMMIHFIENKSDDLNKIFEELNPRDKINVILKIITLIIPKPIENSNENIDEKTVQDLSKLTDDIRGQSEYGNSNR